jgi:dTDP-4-dehydrorhamnose 3,5-epimerase
MQFTRLAIPDVVLIEPNRIGDARGSFVETFRQDRFTAEIGPVEFVQDNQSHSAARGTIRGLHFQREPRAQGKLVRVLGGAILDVAVDIRAGSPSFGRFVTAELSAQNGQQLWIPPGFLHGFCTLTEDVVLAYKVTDYYSPGHDAAVRWDDPAIGIPWPVNSADAVLSDKDRKAPLLQDAIDARLGSARG